MSHPVTPLSKQDVDPIPPRLVPLVRRIMKWSSRFNVWLYEKTDGKLGGRFVIGGAPVCLVSYTGRKTGRRLTTPLIHIPHEDGILLVASAGGLDTNPLWYENIQANPEIEVNERGRTRRMRARRATPAEKLAVWPTIRGVHPDFDEYQARTDRDIPVLICTPVQP
jgi:deazaflavin-dependent oxidoreductase (nitroreductase family)